MSALAAELVEINFAGRPDQTLAAGRTVCTDTADVMTEEVQHAVMDHHVAHIVLANFEDVRHDRKQRYGRF